MKPDWKDAPDWARYLAQDKSGAWNWYQDIPLVDDEESEWLTSTATRVKIAPVKFLDWRETLEQRPTDSGGE